LNSAYFRRLGILSLPDSETLLQNTAVNQPHKCEAKFRVWLAKEIAEIAYDNFARLRCEFTGTVEVQAIRQPKTATNHRI
jgi:hypothetical protein